MKKIDTVTVTVVCPFCKPREFKVDLEVEPANEGEQSSVDVHCPFCDKFVRATIAKKLMTDRMVYRGSGS